MKKIAAKSVSAITVLAFLSAGMVSCAGESAQPIPDAPSSSTAAQDAEEAPKPVDLTGEWKQTNSNSPDSFQTATIVDETIEVFWNATDTKSLYWVGTVEVPADGATSFTWDSVNDKTKTDSAIMASSDDAKTFTYDNGELSYEVTALGTTMTVRLAQE